jgi:hypothetical protein
MTRSAGVWISSSSIWVGILDTAETRVDAFPIARTDGARGRLLSHLLTEGGTVPVLVLTDAHAKLDEIGHLAVKRGITVHLAQWQSVGAIREISGLARGPPRRTAVMLARMAVHPLYRAHLRRFDRRDDRQLSML